MRDSDTGHPGSRLAFIVRGNNGMVCRCPVARKTLRSNRASNLAKCSNFFLSRSPLSFPLLSVCLAARPFYWQVGMFALCIAFASATFMNFAREKRQLFRIFSRGNENFFLRVFRITFRIDGYVIFFWVTVGRKRSRKGIVSRGYIVSAWWVCNDEPSWTEE